MAINQRRSKKSKNNKNRKGYNVRKSNKRSRQHGGSPASDLVNKAALSRPSLNDYVTSPRTRDPWANDMFDGPNCHSGGYNNINKKSKKTKTRKFTGGSVASDYVMSLVNTDAETKQFSKPNIVQGNINSLNTYEISGGSRKKKNKKNKKSKSNKKRKSNKKNKSMRSMRGGYGSDWIASQYSQGPINNQEMSASAVGQFSQSQATPQSILNNPPNMGLAGSGYPMSELEGANVKTTGAPL